MKATEHRAYVLWGGPADGLAVSVAPRVTVIRYPHGFREVEYRYNDETQRYEYAG